MARNQYYGGKLTQVKKIDWSRSASWTVSGETPCTQEVTPRERTQGSYQAPSDNVGLCDKMCKLLRRGVRTNRNSYGHGLMAALAFAFGFVEMHTSP